MNHPTRMACAMARASLRSVLTAIQLAAGGAAQLGVFDPIEREQGTLQPAEFAQPPRRRHSGRG